jgi:hypothetical protein
MNLNKMKNLNKIKNLNKMKNKIFNYKKMMKNMGVLITQRNVKFKHLAVIYGKVKIKL